MAGCLMGYGVGAREERTPGTQQIGARVAHIVARERRRSSVLIVGQQREPASRVRPSVRM